MPHRSNESGQCEVPNLRGKTKTFAKVIYMFLSINISFLLRGCASLRTEARGDGSPGAGSQIMGWLAAFLVVLGIACDGGGSVCSVKSSLDLLIYWVAPACSQRMSFQPLEG